MANTQTSVPLFVANAVLTAAQQNISAATGVPVFATTVTRDAAFGGSNKALAEGQLAYIEASNVVQYYDGAAWATVGPAAASALTLISATTIGTTVASVTVSSAFSSTYDNYKIVVTGGVASAAGSFAFTLGATAAGYYSSLNGRSWANAAIAAGAANTANWGTGEAALLGLNMNMDIYSPFASRETLFTSSQVQASSTGYTYQSGGYLANSTSYTAFTLTSSAGTFTGGTIRVYGYANS